MKITVETNVAAPVEQVWRATPHPRHQTVERSLAIGTPPLLRWICGRWRLFLTHGAKGRRHGIRLAAPIRSHRDKLIEYSFGDRTAQVEFTPGPNGVGVRVNLR